MYKYLNLRFDTRYSKFVSVEDVVEILNSVSKLKRAAPSKFISDAELPWGIINLLQCDSKGNYAVDEESSFGEVNLIEFIFSDEDNAFKEYYSIALNLAEKVNWEIFDASAEKVIRNK